MRYLSILLVLLISATPLCAEHIVDTDSVSFASRAIDTLGFWQPPTSVRVQTFKGAIEVFDQWFTTSDPECALYDSMMVFADRFSDIDGAGGDGIYRVSVGFYYSSHDYYTYQSEMFRVGSSLFPTNFASLAVDGSGQTTVGTNNDKTGYSLSQTFPTNFEDLAITDTDGEVTVGTNNDKTGYGLADGAITAAKIATDAIDSTKIRHDAIGSGEIATNAIGAFELASNCITFQEIADAAITASKMASSQTFSTSGTVGGISGVSFPTNFNLLSIDGNGYVVASQIDGIGFPTNFGLLSIDGSGQVTAGNLVLTSDEQDSLFQASVKNALYWGVCPGGDCDLRLKYGAGATVPDSGQIIDDNAAGADTLVGTIYYEYMDVVVGEDTVTVGTQSGFRKW